MGSSLTGCSCERYGLTNVRLQDEESLLCRVATNHDLVDGMQLSSTPGWATLLAILKESGERPPKRPWPLTEDDGGYTSTSTPGTPSDGEQLAKRFKGASLK